MTLRLRSQRQIQTDIINAIVARLGLTDVNPGSIIDVLTQAVAQEDFNQYVQMSQIVRLVDLDSTTGVDLDNRAFEYGIGRTGAQSAIGTVTLIRTGYTKISTSFVSSGVLAPSEGDTLLRVNDASGFRDSDKSTFGDLTNNIFSQVVIGRGTDNEETRRISFSQNDSLTDNNEGSAGVQEDDSGTFWYISLEEELQNDHSFTEEIVFIPPTPEVGSDTISIPAGTTVSTPSTGTSAAVTFDIIVDYELEQGEDTLINVDVRASDVGSIGNAGSGAISLISLEGIGVSNDSAFTTGTDIESDNGLRDRIRSHIQSLSRGTREAVLNAIVGLVDTATSRRVVSSSVILPQDTNTPVKVYIDDGTGFEPSFTDQSFETVVGSASKGTTRLQLDFAPLVKASIESANSEPFNLSQVFEEDADTGLTLIPRVGSDEEIINIFSTDLDFPATVRAEEIVRIINDRSELIEARTSEGGTKIVITAKIDVNEDIFIFGGTANPFIQFTNNEQSTLYLYKNDKLLSKDGSTAFLDSADGNFSFPNTGAELEVIVDGKSNNAQTVTLSGTLEVLEVVDAINAEVAGLTAIAIESDTKVRLLSNTAFSSSSKLQITSGGANTQLGFSTDEAVGDDRDYTLNRELGTIQLNTSLIDGDFITSGNDFNRASVRTNFPVDNETRIDSSVSFTLRVDEDDTATDAVESGGVEINIVFDDRFSGNYLDSDNVSDGRSETQFGFNRQSFTQLEGGLPALILEFLNDQLYPYATAFVRTVGNGDFIEIRTNTIGSSAVTTTETTDLRNGTLRFTLPSGSAPGLWDGIVTETDRVSGLFQNERPHLAFRETSSTEPTPDGYEFAPTDALIVVINDDFTNGTFNVPMSFTDELDSGETITSRTFTGIDLGDIFTSDSGQLLYDDPTDIDTTNGLNVNNEDPKLPNDINLVDYYLAFTGNNDDDEVEVARNILRIPSNSEVILSTLVTDGMCILGGAMGTQANRMICESEGGAWTYNSIAETSPITSVTRGTGNDAGSSFLFFGSGATGELELSDLSAFASGDIISVADLNQEVNNGSFVIQSIDEDPDTGRPFVQVLDANGVTESNASGSAVISKKRRITAFESTGFVSIGTAGTQSTFFDETPLGGDEYVIIPSTIENLEVQMNNTRLSSLSLTSEIAASDSGTRLQITSDSSGSQGFVEVTGGVANNELDFNTESYRGLQGYNYYIGLLALVHRTIYGDDTDLNTFPGVGAAGVQFQVLAPTVTEIILELDITLNEGVSISAVENQVNTAVTGYINGLGVGEDIIVEEIRSRVIQINGIRDVVIVRLTGGSGGTSFDDIRNIAIADNEIGRIAVSDITIG